jgi:hypothetical protein
VAGHHSFRQAVTFYIYSSDKDTWVSTGDVDRTVAFVGDIRRARVVHYRSDSLDHRFSEHWLDSARFSLREAL